MLTIRVDGYTEAKAILDELPNSMQKKMLLSALKASSQSMVRSARAKVPVRSGSLRKSLRAVRFRDRNAGKGEVSVAVKPVFSRTRKKGKINQYYGKFIHEGTGDPRVSRHKGKVLVFRNRSGETVFARSVKGLKPTPFLEDAYRENSERVIAEFGNNLAGAVEKFVNKNFKPIER